MPVRPEIIRANQGGSRQRDGGTGAVGHTWNYVQVEPHLGSRSHMGMPKKHSPCVSRTREARRLPTSHAIGLFSVSILTVGGTHRSTTGEEGPTYVMMWQTARLPCITARPHGLEAADFLVWFNPGTPDPRHCERLQDSTMVRYPSPQRLCRARSNSRLVLGWGLGWRPNRLHP